MKKRKAWNKGKKTPPEVREKQRQAKLRNPVRYWKGKKRKMTKEWKKNMARNPWNKGKKFPEFSGANHPNWKGTTPLKEAIRKSFEYRQWRSDVFTRDNFTCQSCGNIGDKLHAHHIDKFSDIMDCNKIETMEQAVGCQELWNINNGLSLCIRCHGKEK
jgi:hypothetical protein